MEDVIPFLKFKQPYHTSKLFCKQIHRAKMEPRNQLRKWINDETSMDTHRSHECFALHHVHYLQGDVLPTAGLGFLGAGAQMGTADHVKVVHQRPLLWRFLYTHTQTNKQTNKHHWRSVCMLVGGDATLMACWTEERRLLLDLHLCSEHRQ